VIKYYLPRKKIRFNNHTEVVDESGNVFYNFSGNFFQTKIRLFKPDGTSLYWARLVWSFRRRYDIFRESEKITSIIAKSIFTNYRYDISSFMNNISYAGILWRDEFNIMKDNIVVLSIRKTNDKKYFRIVEVDETNEEYLLMLMFTLIVAVDIPDA
jgi:uncharacterized protein YxjI